MLTPERWSEVQKAFFEALDKSAEERRAYLDQLGASDKSLASEVARMLDANDSASRFVEPPDRDAVSRQMNPADYLGGQRLDDFELQEEIGRGGMGVVYRARQVSLDRLVAVKVLPPALASSNSSLERFRREALSASRLDHPGVAQPIAFGQDNGMAFLAMRLVQGPTLTTELRAQREARPTTRLPRNEKEAAGFIAAVLDALEHVHAAGLIHRDIKPGNLVLTDRGPVLIDFGLAKDVTLADLSLSGVPLGTPYYMSPEQVEAKRNQIDARTDIYSAGIVLYELLAGKAPWVGTRPETVCTEILRNHIPPLPASVSRDLATIVSKATEGVRDVRYQTAAEMAADLRRFINGEPISARPQSIARRVKRFASRHRVVATAGPVLVVGLLIGMLGGPGSFWGSEVQAGNPDAITLSVDLSKAAVTDDLRLDVHAFVDPFGSQLLESRYSVLDQGQLDTLPPGTYRFVFTAPDGRQAELIAGARAGELLELAPVGFDLPVAPEGYASFQGGTFLPGALGPGLLASQAYLSMFPEAELPIAVPAFAISKAPVTHGELRAAFEAVGEWPPLGSSSQWLSLVLPAYDEPPRDDWDELPATYVTLPVARRYAALVGGRLPTYGEHLFVTQLLMPEWDPSTTNLLDSTATTPDTSDGEYAPYIELVMPAATDPQGPQGIFQWFGNVTTYVEAPLFIDFAEDMVLRSDVSGGYPFDYATNVGGFWNESSQFMQQFGAVQPRWFSDPDGAPEVGFRVARSL